VVDRKRHDQDGGENVASESRETIYELDGVAESRCSHLPSALDRGRHRVIVLKAGAALTEDECMPTPRPAGGFKRPKYVVFADTCENPSGKISSATCASSMPASRRRILTPPPRPLQFTAAEKPDVHGRSVTGSPGACRSPRAGRSMSSQEKPSPPPSSSCADVQPVPAVSVLVATVTERR